MLYRIIVFSLFGLLVLSFVLTFAGIHEVQLGNGFTNWLRFVNTKYESWKLVIPDIPDIPQMDTESIMNTDFSVFDAVSLALLNIGQVLVKAVVWLADKLVIFFNFLIKLINIVIHLLNVLIQLIQFVLTMVYCVTQFKEYMSQDLWTSNLNIQHIQPFVI